MNTVEIISLIASIASLILAVVAIWLSIEFYKQSSQLSESAKEAAKGIGASVDRLENLFDKLYSDTFTMMKDTVSDMRKHIWPEETGDTENLTEEIEMKADEKIDAFKKEIVGEIGTILDKQRMTEDKMQALSSEMNQVVSRAIARSRQAELEAREETLRSRILRTHRVLRRRKKTVMASEIVERLEEIAPTIRIVQELEKMKEEKIINYDDEHIGPETRIELS